MAMSTSPYCVVFKHITIEDNTFDNWTYNVGNLMRWRTSVGTRKAQYIVKIIMLVITAIV